MQNIHVLPTKNASRLYRRIDLNELYLGDFDFCKADDKLRVNQHIYITSDSEIKDGDWHLDCIKDYETIEKAEKDWCLTKDHKKIILTTDQDLIADGVQAIDDEFLQWFVKNPSCEKVEVKPLLSNNGRVLFGYKIIIPKEEQTKCYCGHTNYCDCGPNEVPIEEPKQEYKDKKFQQNLVNKLRSGELTYENTSIYTVILDLVQGNGKEEVLRVFNEVIMEEPKQETLEEVDENKKNLYYHKQVMNPYPVEEYSHTAYEKGFIEGYQESTKWQQEQDKNKFSEEEVKAIWKAGQEYWKTSGKSITFEELTEQFKKK